MSHDYFADPAWWSNEGTRGARPPVRQEPRRRRSPDEYPRRPPTSLEPHDEPQTRRVTRIPVVAARPPSADEPREPEPAPLLDDAPKPDHAIDTSPNATASPSALDAERDDGDERDRLRAAALEFEEAKRRVEREAERTQEQLRGQLLSELLPVLDNLDRSIDAMNHSHDADLHEGLELVRQQFEGVLQSYGVERIDAVGDRFDPALHEAIGMVEVDSVSDEARVMQQWQPGFRFGARVLRPAKVQVGKLSVR